MNKVFICICCLLLANVCSAEVDTLYSEPMVDGKITTLPNGSLVTNGTDTYFEVGDGYEFTNSYERPIRGYVSFYIDSLSDTITVNSAQLKAHQYRSVGNNVWGVFPIWNVPGGDTLYCVIDHIDYGPSIDTLDWTAGDPGDPRTFVSNFGIISSTADTGWKSLDVTPCVIADRNAGRLRTQFRIRFPILMDNDDSTDCLYFHTGNALFGEIDLRPKLIIDYLTGVEGNLNDSNIGLHYKLQYIYPVPFNNYTTVVYNLGGNTPVNLNVYNIKGGKVKTLVNKYQAKGVYNVIWHGCNDENLSLPSGIYFVKLNTNENQSLQKIILLK